MITDTAKKTATINYPLQNAWHTRFAKRTLDIVASALGLLVLWPIFLLVAVLIKRDSPGPVFFRGPRMGRDGQVFQILKFRTMRECSESYAGPKITAEGDGRITPLGKWLRDTKLNELPQLWNVLVGEMSLVGPRPEDIEIAARWPEEARREILSVRPGITSPASISYHDEEKLLSRDNPMGDYLEKIAPDKIRLDRLYVRHHNLMTDLDAIFWTLIVLLPRIERPHYEGWLFGGPFTRLARPYLGWGIIDFATALFSAALVGLIWRAFAPLHIGWNWAPLVALGLALEFGLVNFLLGLSRVEWSRAAPEDVFSLFSSCGIVFALNVLADVYLPIVNIPSGYLLAASLVTLSGFIITRYRLRLLTGLAARWVNLRRGGLAIGERVLVVGAGSGGEMATWLLRRADFGRLFSVHGYVDDDPSKQGMRYDGVPVLGTTADLPALVEREDIGLVVYAISKIAASDRDRIFSACHRVGAQLVIFADVLQSFQSHFSPINGKKPNE
jgi:lipopolysaccharide/colanic/teichoic acid biosynthesis glycosyltransferase